MISFEIADVIQVIIVIFVAGGTIAAMKAKQGQQQTEIDGLKKTVGDMSEEMRAMHSEQGQEIANIKNEYHDIRLNLAVMVEGQKGMTEALKRIETSLKDHVEKEE